MTEPTKSLLDLIPAGPVRSEPIKFKDRQAKFRLLNSAETMACRTAAVKTGSAVIAFQLDIPRAEAVGLLDAAMNSDNMIELFELYMLAAALTDLDGSPIASGDQNEIMRQLGAAISPMDRKVLVAQYLEFADEHDPERLSDDDIKEMMANLGKLQDTSVLRQYGSSVLRNCVLTLAEELMDARRQLELMEPSEDQLSALEISQIRKSWDGIALLSSVDASASKSAEPSVSPKE